MTSATGPSERAHGAAGFTLVELVVAIAIIGIASAALVLALPGPETRVRAAAERLAARAAATRDAAILTGRSTRFDARLPAEFHLTRQPDAPILFDATGLATPAELRIEAGGAVATVSIDAAGGVHAGA